MRRPVAKSLSIGVAIAAAVWSVCIFAGWVLPTLDATYRLLFGAITALYGIYRLVLGFTKKDLVE